MASLRRATVVATLAAAVAATAGCSSSTRSGSSSTPVTAVAGAIASPTSGPADTTARRVVASFKVGAKIGPIAVGDGWLWATNANGTVVGEGSNGTTPSLMRLDATSHAVTATVDLATNPWTIVVAGGQVYVGLSGGLVAVDAATMRVTGQYSAPGDPTAMAATPGTVWVAYAHDGTVVRFDTTSHAVTATTRITTAAVAMQQERGEPASLVVAGGAVWASMDAEGRVARIDPASARITATYALPTGAGGFMAAAPDGSIWMTSLGRLVHIDTRTGASQALTVELPGAGALVARDREVWVVGAASKLYHVDVAASRVVETVAFTGGPVAIADDGDAMWIASLANDLTHVDIH